jgi:ribonuclease HI
VKGHAGDHGNEACDRLAAAAIDRIRKQHTREQLATSLAAFKASQQQNDTPELV